MNKTGNAAPARKAAKRTPTQNPRPTAPLVPDVDSGVLDHGETDKPTNSFVISKLPSVSGGMESRERADESKNSFVISKLPSVSGQVMSGDRMDEPANSFVISKLPGVSSDVNRVSETGEQTNLSIISKLPKVDSASGLANDMRSLKNAPMGTLTRDNIVLPKGGASKEGQGDMVLPVDQDIMGPALVPGNHKPSTAVAGREGHSPITKVKKVVLRLDKPPTKPLEGGKVTEESNSESLPPGTSKNGDIRNDITQINKDPQHEDESTSIAQDLLSTSPPC
ncbi:hypothetical protein DFJ58DRAFT_733306 [Suillus subalutaceus]|uniref:uncharacterized protein n=1 Tax=Suillus subalutaceus TaxID=48586 RepID=UPI001B875D43|nr:uncharacterized protein DFJ58DRAFT_733306 [Suillus subalutaceus]KAG1839439.1 hypothetical protein DFJ58DRAFT_733306 [Suillus subalutaceus]